MASHPYSPARGFAHIPPVEIGTAAVGETVAELEAAIAETIQTQQTLIGRWERHAERQGYRPATYSAQILLLDSRLNRLRRRLLALTQTDVFEQTAHDVNTDVAAMRGEVC